MMFDITIEIKKKFLCRKLDFARIVQESFDLEADWHLSPRLFRNHFVQLHSPTRSYYFLRQIQKIGRIL